MRRFIIIFLIKIMFFCAHYNLLFAQNNDSNDRNTKNQLDSDRKLLEKFLDSNIFKSDHKDIEKLLENFQNNFHQQHSQMLEQMQKQMDAMLSDEGFGSLLGGNDIFGQLDNDSSEWIENRNQKIFIYKLDATPNDSDDSPLTIDIKDGRIRVSGEIKKIKASKGQFGTSKSVSIQRINRSFSVPDDVDPDSAKIESKNGNIQISFNKLRPGTSSSTKSATIKKAKPNKKDSQNIKNKRIPLTPKDATDISL